MLVSQLIYTGCGKNKTGAYSVWSKSDDITKEEGDEISAVMQYKRLMGLPYEPTDEELKTLFQKKVAFFKLSSGKGVLAQSSYIGKVYSDFDSRTGNYIIHAFVFDIDELDIVPTAFIGSDIFKTHLTYEEWHENDAPETLPKIEISMKDAAPSASVGGFFKDKVQSLARFIEAFRIAMSSDKSLIFNDKEENLKYWYAALAAAIPEEDRGNFTFCTFYTPGASSPVIGSASVQNIKVTNDIPSVSTGVYAYSERARDGELIFDFESGLYPEAVNAGSFASTFAETYARNQFESIVWVGNIVKIAKKYSVSYDDSVALSHLLAGRYERLGSASSIMSVVDFAVKKGSNELTSIADGLYKYAFESGRLPIAPSSSALYKFIFEYSAAADKMAVVEKYISSLSDFGINDSLGLEAFVEAVSEKAPFDWNNNFVNYIFMDGKLDEYTAKYASRETMSHLVFTSLVVALSKGEITKDARKKQQSLNYLLKVVTDALSQKSLDKVKFYLSALSKINHTIGEKLVILALESLEKSKGGVVAALGAKFSFDLAEALSENAFDTIMNKIVSQNKLKENFLPYYVKQKASKEAYYRAFEEKHASEHGAFFESCTAYGFENGTGFTQNQLAWYFENRFKKGKDKGGYFEKAVLAYVGTVSSEQDIEKAIDIYNRYIKDQNLASTAKEVVSRILSCDMTKLFKYAERSLSKIEELYKANPDLSDKVKDRYSVLRFGVRIRRVTPEDKAKILSLIEEKRFYPSLSDKDGTTLIFNLLLEEILSVYMLVAGKDNWDNVMTELIGTLSHSPRFEEKLVMAIQALDYDAQYSLVLVSLWLTL